jgi:esterase/lipase superfamily enzyme
MHREYHKWYSPRLNRDMELNIYGHAGARVLVFPTSMGRFYEYEDRGMVANLGDQLENGWLQLYCVDSVDAESFYNNWALSRSRNGNPFLMTHGCSFGAYHAVNIAFRHPHLFGRVLALSGKYDMTGFFNGYYDDNIYYNTPSHYVPNLSDHGQLEALRHVDIVIVAGEHDPNIENNRALSRALWAKGVPNAFREWAGWSHDWPYWKEMVRKYIGGHD